MFRPSFLFSGAVIIGLSGVGLAVPASPVSAANHAFYVDCVTGSDTATGRSPSLAWKTLARANEATLVAGDSLLFKRGCVWTGGKGLTAPWIGTAAAPITIGGYGTDTRMPGIADTGNYGILVTGKYEIIDGFQVSFKPVQLDPCGQPLGTYYAAVITQGGAHNTITNSLLTRATAGIHISATAGPYNTITKNTLSGNNVMQVPFDGVQDLGAWGILVRGNNNDISYNTFRNNRAVCTKSGYVPSNSVEIYEGDFNRIHHNRSENDRVFSELGGSATNKASDNSYEYNLVRSNIAGACFITTRGAQDTTYGPVPRTTALRNTIYYTGAGSQGIVCSLGCTPKILSASFNVIDVVEKTIYFDDTMGQDSNVLWSHGLPVHIEDGAGHMRTMLNKTTPESIVADPRFVNTTNLNFRLQADSPGINSGGPSNYPVDLQSHPANNGPAPDVGAYER